MSDYLEKLERQVNETENTSVLFGNISIVNSPFLKKAVEELKAARKVVEAARHIHWQCTQQRMENLHMALKELEGGEK